MAYTLAVEDHVGSEDIHLQHLGGLHANVFHLAIEVGGKGIGRVVAFRSAEREERMESAGRKDAVAPYLLPFHRAADYGLRDMAEEELMEYLLRLLYVAAAGYVFKMMERGLPFLDPAGLKTSLSLITERHIRVPTR